MADKKLQHGDKGDFHSLKIDTIDESDIITDNTDSRFGLPRFLLWETRKSPELGEYLEAKTKDSKTIRIVEDKPPQPPKKGKVEIIG